MIEIKLSYGPDPDLAREKGFYNRIRNWRALASRCDKYAVVYRGGIVLAAILDWLE